MKTIQIALVILLMAGCTQPPLETTPQKKEFHDHTLFAEYAERRGLTIDETNQFFLKTYGLTNEKDIYSNLPAPPDDFQQWKLILDGKDGNALALTPNSAFLQPEFYPTFTEKGTQSWTDAPPSTPYTFGVSGTPGTQRAEINTGTADFETTLFVTASWGSTVYQGMHLRFKVIPEAPIQLEFTPHEFILGPNFPQFSNEWAQKVHIRGKMVDVPEGEYHVYVIPIEPNPIEVQKWKDEGKEPYINAAGAIYSEQGIGELIIKVTPGEE